MKEPNESEDEQVYDEAFEKIKVVGAYIQRAKAAMNFHVTSMQGMTAVASGVPGGQAFLNFRKTPLGAVAAEEISAGFRTLNAQLLVRTCGDLEALCHDFLRVCLKYDNTLIRKEPLSKVKFTTSELLSMTEAERADALAIKLMEEFGTPNRLGIDRFHTVFTFIGFSFPIEEQWRRPLLEMYAVRNLILHRSGIVDRRFMLLCPWVGAQLDSVWQVTSASVADYIYAADCYFNSFRALLVKRIEPLVDGLQGELEAKKRKLEMMQESQRYAITREMESNAKIEPRPRVPSSRKKRSKSRKSTGIDAGK